jgi:hypothetical protein
MNLISPPQYQALDRYLDTVARYAQDLHILDLLKKTPLAEISDWQEDKLKSAESLMKSEEMKLNAACDGNFKALFPNNLIASMLARKMSIPV